jgi:hypothetical protein
VTYDGASKFSSNVETSLSSELVDVRIIDFAHSTHQGLKDSTLHDGPDRGFINGIQVLKLFGFVGDATATSAVV